MASVALMAPRVKRERMGGSNFDIIGYLGGPKVRNLGCRVRFGSRFILTGPPLTQLIREGDQFRGTPCSRKYLIF